MIKSDHKLVNQDDIITSEILKKYLKNMAALSSRIRLNILRCLPSDSNETQQQQQQQQQQQ